jgi:hypothetical protein
MEGAMSDREVAKLDLLDSLGFDYMDANDAHFLTFRGAIIVTARDRERCPEVDTLKELLCAKLDNFRASIGVEIERSKQKVRDGAQLLTPLPTDDDL